MLTLTADNLTVSRGGRTIIADLSFRVEGGKALLLTGPNGSGKTTLLRAIAGLIRTDAGMVSLDGELAIDGFANFKPDPDATVGEQAHYVGHLNAVKPNLTVRENLQFWANAHNGKAEAVREAVAGINLDAMAGIPAGYLSAGQKRRLGLGRLLVAWRPVWLLDEPTVSLDAASVTLFAAIVKQHLARGGIVAAATHTPLGLDGAAELKLGVRTEAA